MSQQVTQMTIEQATALASRVEDLFFDKKSIGSSGKTAQKIVVAFGNSEGGEVVFGIKDDKEESDPKKDLICFQTLKMQIASCSRFT